MTRLTMLAALVIGTALGCERTDTASVPAESATVETVANTTVVRFDVEGMTCGGCANAVKQIIRTEVEARDELTLSPTPVSTSIA